MPTFGSAPQWGSKWKAFVSENAGRWLGAYAQCNSLPYENTWLDLDPEVKDPLGDPVCRITSGPKENEPRASAHAAKKAAEWFRAAGARSSGDHVPNTEGPNLSTHAVGGTRMGLKAEIERGRPLRLRARIAESRDLGRIGAGDARRA